jgi:hypothetical protein
MVKRKGGLNPEIDQGKVDAVLAKAAKLSGQCHFFESPEAASQALQSIGSKLHAKDEFFLLPVDDSSLAVCVHCDDSSKSALSALGLKEVFFLPFISPGKGDEN